MDSTEKAIKNIISEAHELLLDYERMCKIEKGYIASIENYQAKIKELEQEILLLNTTILTLQTKNQALKHTLQEVQDELIENQNPFAVRINNLCKRLFGESNPKDLKL